MGFKKKPKPKASSEPEAPAGEPIKKKKEWEKKFREKYHRDPVSEEELARFVYWQNEGWQK